MPKPTLKITQPGMLTTIQDRGRYGYQRFGMPTAGAMDAFALRAANALLANPDNAACIEITVLGPRIDILADTKIAITGANLSPTLDGKPLPMWQAAPVSKGSTLAFRGPQDGVRAYLALQGGIDVPQIMGSRSTYIKAAIGGIDGRPLRPGDIIQAITPGASAASDTPTDTIQAILPNTPAKPHTPLIGIPPHAIPQYGSSHSVRVVLGPQRDAFTDSGIATLLTETYAVSINSDRMGYRLEGKPIEHKRSADVISDGTPLGTIQVPGDGQPIILLADRGTTGGYTKIATVITADLSKIAQAMPGHTVSFEAISVEQAQAIHRQQEALLQEIRRPAPRIAVVLPDAVSDILDAGGDPITLPTAGDPVRQFRKSTTQIDGVAYEFDISVRRLD